VNRLSAETSPYLRQHADNPVDWYPWSEDAFAAAKLLDRPVMLSVGYSACHWCHVMAHESFEDEETAAELNSRFVSVKVDREERPDVDTVYMEAVQALSGRGGWPMTVFLTPDGRPFFAGTYFPLRDMPGMPSFRRVLDAVDDAWHNRRAEVERQADALTDAVDRRTRLPEEYLVGPALSDDAPAEIAGADPGMQPSAPSSARRAPGRAGPLLLRNAVSELARRYDVHWGGFGPAPKFPHPSFVELCLLDHRLSDDPRSLAMAEGTLGAMARGGVYDHLGGGFHRYSTDETWTVPHFEKMLYDQAGLVRAYLHAWQMTRRPEWLQVVEETVGYVLRDMALSSGGLCSAEDADSEGEEGLFYTWRPEEIEAVVPDDAAPVVVDWYQVSRSGNFEGRSVLRRPRDAPLGRPGDIEAGRVALFEARSQRVRPGRDDKVLTEWNAMFAAVLAEAAGATGREDWGAAATALAEFLVRELRRESDGRWLRSWKGGRAQHLAYAADHAWLVEMFTRMSELTGRSSWLDHASATAKTMLELFSHDASASRRALPLYTTAKDAQKLVVRPMEITDGVTPSGTSVAAAALLRLAALTGDDDLAASGESLLSSVVELGRAQPLAVANAIASCSLSQTSGIGVTEVVVGGNRPDLVGACQSRYEPTAALAWGEPTGSPLWEGRRDPLAYVCRDRVCSAPVGSVEDLVAVLDRQLEEQKSLYSRPAVT
jgi:uncharacterized protein YyaL (SSP411 family)